MEKLEWWVYQRVKKVRKKYLLISTEYMNVTDRQTDGRTNRQRVTA